MLELFAVFTRSGLLCFLYNPFGHENAVHTVNRFIESTLIYAGAVALGDSSLAVNDGVTWKCSYSLGDQEHVMLACYPSGIPQAGAYVPVLFEIISSRLNSISTLSASDFETLVQQAEAGSASASPLSSNGHSKKSAKTSVKAGRKWDDQVDAAARKTLDHSKATQGKSSTGDVSVVVKDIPILEREGRKAKSQPFWSSLRQLAQTTLTEENLEPVCRQLRDHLISKNVAVSLSEEISEGVRKKLLNQQISSFGSIEQAVFDAADDSIRPLIGAQTASHFLATIKASSTERPYTIVFVGVNGVGKSTSLAKVAAWLLSNQLRVLIVAGDTFRAGAVEQLAQHVANLQRAHGERVQLFDRGYGRDAAVVVESAVKEARKGNFDVMLVDSAGRMPQNQPLMQSLRKMVMASDPDRVLFVGEALIGNDSLMQLQRFNEALLPNRIDGLIVSKFDTVDDKVGTVLNLSHAGHCPVTFVGSGQTYGDLRTLSIDQVLDTLLS